MCTSQLGRTWLMPVGSVTIATIRFFFFFFADNHLVPVSSNRVAQLKVQYKVKMLIFRQHTGKNQKQVCEYKKVLQEWQTGGCAQSWRTTATRSDQQHSGRGRWERLPFWNSTPLIVHWKSLAGQNCDSKQGTPLHSRPESRKGNPGKGSDTFSEMHYLCYLDNSSCSDSIVENKDLKQSFAHKEGALFLPYKKKLSENRKKQSNHLLWPNWSKYFIHKPVRSSFTDVASIKERSKSHQDMQEKKMFWDNHEGALRPDMLKSKAWELIFFFFFFCPPDVCIILRKNKCGQFIFGLEKDNSQCSMFKQPPYWAAREPVDMVVWCWMENKNPPQQHREGWNRETGTEEERVEREEPSTDGHCCD